MVTNGFIRQGSSSNQTISSVIGGNYHLTKTGTNTLTLSGANIYTGSTIINNGKLSVIGSSVTSYTVNSPGILEFNNSTTQTHTGSVTGTGTISKIGSGTLYIQGASSNFLGTISWTSGNLGIAHGGALGAGQTASSLPALTILNNGNFYINGTLTTDASRDITFSGASQLFSIVNNGFTATLGNKITNNHIARLSGTTGSGNITLNNTNCSFNVLQRITGQSGQTTNVSLGFPANAAIPCVNLCGGHGTGSNSGATGSILFITNNNQLVSTCKFSAASNRAYSRLCAILLNGTNQECGGWTNDNCGGTKYDLGNRGYLGNGHATIQSTCTLNIVAADVTDQGAGYKQVGNYGAAALNIIKKGVYKQTFYTDTRVTYTGYTDLQNGILNTPLPASTDWRITVNGTSPTSTSGSANSGKLEISSASPNFAGKTIDVTSDPNSDYWTYTLVSWSGTSSNTPVIKMNGTTRTFGTPFTYSLLHVVTFNLNANSITMTVAML